MEESKRGHVYSKPKPPPSTAQIKSIFKITQLAGRGFRVRSKKDGQNQRETKIQVKQAQQKITALVNQSSHDDQKAKAAPLGVPTNPQSGAAVPGTHKVTTMKVHQTMTKEEAEIIVVDVLKHFSSVCNHFLEKKKKHKGKVYEEVVNNRAAEVIEIIKGMQAEREKLVKIHQKRKKFDRDIYQAKYDASMDVFDAAVKSAVTAKKKFARARRAARRRALKASQGRRTRPKSSKSTKERVHSALERKTREYVEKEEEDLNSDFSESEEEEEQTGRVQDARKGLGELQDEWRSTMQNIRNLKKKLVKYVAKDPACRDLPKAEQQTMANTLALLLLKAQDIESGEFWTDENLRRASMKQKPTIYCQGAEQWFKPKSKGWVADAYEATKWSSLGLLYSQIGLTGLRFAKESEEAVGYWATLWKACGILSSVAAMLNPAFVVFALFAQNVFGAATQTMDVGRRLVHQAAGPLIVQFFSKILDLDMDYIGSQFDRGEMYGIMAAVPQVLGSVKNFFLNPNVIWMLAQAFCTHLIMHAAPYLSMTGNGYYMYLIEGIVGSVMVAARYFITNNVVRRLGGDWMGSLQEIYADIALGKRITHPIRRKIGDLLTLKRRVDGNWGTPLGAWLWVNDKFHVHLLRGWGVNRQIGIMVLMPLMKFGYAFFSGWMDSADGTIVAHCEVNGKTCVVTMGGETVTIDKGDLENDFMEQNQRKIIRDYDDPYNLAEGPMMNVINLGGLVSGTVNALRNGDMTVGVELISNKQPTVESFSQIPVTAVNTLIKVTANNAALGVSTAVTATTGTVGSWIKTYGPQWLSDLFEITVNSADPRIGKGVSMRLSGNNFTNTFKIEGNSVAGKMFADAFKNAQNAQNRKDANAQARKTLANAANTTRSQLDLEGMQTNELVDKSLRDTAEKKLKDLEGKKEAEKEQAVKEVRDVGQKILDEAGLVAPMVKDYSKWKGTGPLDAKKVNDALKQLKPAKQSKLKAEMKKALDKCRKLNEENPCGRQLHPFRQKTTNMVQLFPGVGFFPTGIPTNGFLDAYERSPLDWDDVVNAKTQEDAKTQEETLEDEAMAEAQAEGRGDREKEAEREPASTAGKRGMDIRPDEGPRQTDAERNAEILSNAQKILDNLKKLKGEDNEPEPEQPEPEQPEPEPEPEQPEPEQPEPEQAEQADEDLLKQFREDVTGKPPQSRGLGWSRPEDAPRPVVPPPPAPPPVSGTLAIGQLGGGYGLLRPRRISYASYVKKKKKK